MMKLAESDRFVIVERTPAKPDATKKHLSDDEIKAARDWERERVRGLRAAWSAIVFGSNEFDRVMEFAKHEFHDTKAWTEKTAWVEASQGFLASLDPHSALVTKTAWDEATKKTQDKNVQGSLLANHAGVADLKITGFVKTTNDDIHSEMSRLAKFAPAGLRGVVLDLRNDSGGLLNQGIKLSDDFLKRGVIASVKGRNAADDEVYSATASEEWDFPLVVLVNSSTASAAEIVASSLQDNRRALIIGDRTYGKASVQTLYSPLLQDDYYIKLTVAQYETPSGRIIQGTGVHPDISVPPEKGGKLPTGFREENPSGDGSDADYLSANKELADRARICADKTTRKGSDWQLTYAGEVLECVISDASAHEK